MPIKLAMYQKSLDHIGERLSALGLDLDIVTFGDDGRYQIAGTSTAPEEVDVDYLWLSSHINAAQKTAFDTALATRKVGVLQTFNAGLDHPFYKAISDKGTTICNSSAQGVAIAEYVMAQVMSVVHPVELQRKQQAEKVWKITRFRELSRMNWLIVGYGPIGQEISKRVKAFGTTTAVVRRSPQTSDLVDEAGTLADIHGFLPKADVVVLACPLNDTTRGMADAAFFAAMKQDAILVNIARGGLIDDAAMIKALDDGPLATAILDVFHTEPLPTDDPLWSHPKIRLTPHTSFGGDGVQARWDRLFLDNIARFAKGEALGQVVAPGDI